MVPAVYGRGLKIAHSGEIRLDMMLVCGVNEQT